MSAEAQRILVVDDDRITRQLLGSILEDEGYTADQCSEGAAALEMLKLYSYAALLTDYMMPRMTGIELTRRARELQPSISCFVITGIERPALADADLVTWLTKPIDVDAVVTSLRCTLSLCP